MIVKEQLPIVFKNKCGAKFSDFQLAKAIIWKAERPVCRVKTVFMNGKYPAISIHGKKHHIHRLIMEWRVLRKLNPKEYVHHIDGNKLNATVTNLEIMDEATHQSHHNKGKVVSLETRQKLVEANKRKWATDWAYRRKKVFHSPELLERE